MKLAALVEADGEQVVAFSNALDDVELTPENEARARKVGTGLFKAGFTFNMNDPDQLEFKLRTEEGLSITASLAYVSDQKWGIVFEAQDHNTKYVWDSSPLVHAATLDIPTVIKSIDGIFHSLDETNLLLGTKGKNK